MQIVIAAVPVTKNSFMADLQTAGFKKVVKDGSSIGFSPVKTDQVRQLIEALLKQGWAKQRGMKFPTVDPDESEGKPCYYFQRRGLYAAIVPELGWASFGGK